MPPKRPLAELGPSHHAVQLSALRRELMLARDGKERLLALLEESMRATQETHASAAIDNITLARENNRLNAEILECESALRNHRFDFELAEREHARVKAEHDAAVNIIAEKDREIARVRAVLAAHLFSERKCESFVEGLTQEALESTSERLALLEVKKALKAVVGSSHGGIYTLEERAAQLRHELEQLKLRKGIVDDTDPALRLKSGKWMRLCEDPACVDIRSRVQALRARAPK
jgi:hypothetical protein